MGYGLGIDVGTTYTAAAIGRDGAVEALSLGVNQVAVPSVVFAEGDEVLVGAPAVRRGALNPSGMAREFKRRLGDPVPVVLSGSPYHADRLTALMANWVVGAVSEQLGEAPERIVMTHPANWTQYQLGLLAGALTDAGLVDVELISEPAAAALDFAAAARVEPGALLLVYDLGGGTFDVALLRRDNGGFEHEIEPFGIERLGGIDFDEAVFHHVVSQLPDDVVAEARRSPEGVAGLAQVRRSCVEAKESLSSDVAADVPVMLPGHTASVRITRAEFEDMIRPMIRQTIDGVANTMRRSHVDPATLAAVLLVGGSSRIPLVPHLVAEELGLPVRVDAHPKLVVAKGAARRAGERATGGRAAPTAGQEPARPWYRRPQALVAAAALVMAAGAAVWLITRDGGADDPDVAAVTSPPPATVDDQPDDATDVPPDTGAPATGVPADTGGPPPDTGAPDTGGPGDTSDPDQVDLDEPDVVVPSAPFAPRGGVFTDPLPFDIAVVDSDLWVVSLATGTLARFDLDQPHVIEVENSSLGFSEPFSLTGNDIIVADDALYVTQHHGESVARVALTEPSGLHGRVDRVDRIPVPGLPLNGATMGSTVWVSIIAPDESGALLPIDGTSVGSPLALPHLASAVIPHDALLWVAFFRDGRLGRVDPVDGTVDVMDVDGEPRDLLVVDDELWVTLIDQDRVAIVDPATMTVIEHIDVGPRPHKLLSALGSVWISNEGSGPVAGNVVRLDPATRTPVQEPIAAGLRPQALAAGDFNVYVADHEEQPGDVERYLQGDPELELGPGIITILGEPD